MAAVIHPRWINKDPDVGSILGPVRLLDGVVGSGAVPDLASGPATIGCDGEGWGCLVVRFENRTAAPRALEAARGAPGSGTLVR